MAGRLSQDTSYIPIQNQLVNAAPSTLSPLSATDSQVSDSNSSTETATATNCSVFSDNIRESRNSRQSEITADDSDLVDGYASSLNSSYLTSIASNVRRGVLENGRIYPGYGRHLATFPMDDKEQELMDLYHEKQILLLEGRLHLSPISSLPQKILDLGTGTGLWAIDMADKYPSATVQGVDIAPIAPNWVPPNCTFEVEDVEDDWVESWHRDSYDLIHARELILSIRDWDKLIQQCYSRLVPGGWIELEGAVLDPTSDDGTLPEESLYIRTGKLVREIGNRLGTSVDAPYTWKRRLPDHGFTNVHEIIFKVPLGPWPKDKRLKEIGAINLTHSLEGIEAIMLRGYTRVLGGSYDQCQVLMAAVRQEMINPKVHSHFKFVNVYGQKPESPTPWS